MKYSLGKKKLSIQVESPTFFGRANHTFDPFRAEAQSSNKG
jgi:hypothetical protein